MDLLSNLSLGFQVALTPASLMYCFIGVFLGTLIGVLPGIGPLATIAMLLPITYGLAPVSALIMLAGIYYGAQYGGSTTSILVNLPGEASSVVTTLDGYQMARRGRAGPALATAALASFFAGTVATLILAAFAAPLTVVALEFGPAEYFALMVLGLVGAVALASGSLAKALAMIVLGLILGLVGTDINSGRARLSLGIPELLDGIGFVIIAMGAFGFAEIAFNLAKKEERSVVNEKVLGLMPTAKDLKDASGATLRGTALGSALGILPGGGALLASFAAYSFEKWVAKDRSTFGKGDIRGVAAPEAANNAGAQTSFVPMLTLGLPSNAVMALMIGAMMIHNIQPGPQVMSSNPQLFWGLIASMWIGNVMLVILNLPLIGIWVHLLRVPYRFLFPSIIVFCCIGVYSISNSTFDVMLCVVFAIIGWTMSQLKCEVAPMLLGFILGPMMEENFRRALVLSRGDFTTFVERPISVTLLALAAILTIVLAMPRMARLKEKVATDD
ncbi:MAG: tripartite tricarboxylate transporter permease [Alphaproteobacteria bacterium]|nr:tripartite tricarboxylate transporter permease [Alphaproteobacteria bacterium]